MMWIPVAAMSNFWKSHVSHFELTNAMVLLIMLSVSCDANTGIVTSTTTDVINNTILFIWSRQLKNGIKWLVLVMWYCWHADDIVNGMFFYVDGSFSLFLIEYTLAPLKLWITEYFSNADRLSTWQTTWLHLVCGKLYLPKFILITDDTVGCVMSDTWCKIAWHQIVGVGPHTCPMLWGVDTNCEPLCPLLTKRGCGPCTVSTWRCERIGSIWVGGQGCWTWPHPICGAARTSQFLLRDGSLTLMYMGSLMVIAMLCNSLPTMEKLSTLVGSPAVLVWS